MLLFDLAPSKAMPTAAAAVPVPLAPPSMPALNPPPVASSTLSSEEDLLFGFGSDLMAAAPAPPRHWVSVPTRVSLGVVLSESVSLVKQVPLNADHLGEVFSVAPTVERIDGTLGFRASFTWEAKEVDGPGGAQGAEANFERTVEVLLQSKAPLDFSAAAQLPPASPVPSVPSSTPVPASFVSATALPQAADSKVFRYLLCLRLGPFNAPHAKIEGPTAPQQSPWLVLSQSAEPALPFVLPYRIDTAAFQPLLLKASASCRLTYDASSAAEAASGKRHVFTDVIVRAQLHPALLNASLGATTAPGVAATAGTAIKGLAFLAQLPMPASPSVPTSSYDTAVEPIMRPQGGHWNVARAQILWNVPDGSPPAPSMPASNATDTTARVPQTGSVIELFGVGKVAEFKARCRVADGQTVADGDAEPTGLVHPLGLQVKFNMVRAACPLLLFVPEPSVLPLGHESVVDRSQHAHLDSVVVKQQSTVRGLWKLQHE
jgi:hypothetical protein